MIHESVVKLLKLWKEKALQMESQAEQETGLKRERLLAMAQVLYGCEEDLRTGIMDEYADLAEDFLALSDRLKELIPEGQKDEPESPPKTPDRS